MRIPLKLVLFHQGQRYFVGPNGLPVSASNFFGSIQSPLKQSEALQYSYLSERSCPISPWKRSRRSCREASALRTVTTLLHWNIALVTLLSLVKPTAHLFSVLFCMRIWSITSIQRKLLYELFLFRRSCCVG